MVHIVQLGECLTSIAARYGFQDAKTLYDDPANAELKAKRPDPNLLYPGDEINIPDFAPKTVVLATGATHKFIVKRQKRTLKVSLQQGTNAALADMPYRLVGDNFEAEGRTTSDGLITQEIPARLRELTIVIGRTRLVLHVGDLNPMRDVGDQGVSGAQARLANLGFAPGPIDGVLGPRTERAIREFQSSKGLDETGQLDDAVIDALASDHGC